MARGLWGVLMCQVAAGGGFVAVSEGHIEVLCASALSMFLIKATHLERIKCFGVVQVWPLLSVIST